MSTNTESSPNLDIDLKTLILLVSRATWAVDSSDAERVLNWLANELEEQMDIKREDLRKVFDYIDVPLWDNGVEEDEEEQNEEQSNEGDEENEEKTG